MNTGSRIVAANGICAIALFAQPKAWAADTQYVAAESVNDYSYFFGSTLQDIDCYSEAQGFYDGITTSGSGWFQGPRRHNSAVYDTDFRDPDATGDVRDNDTANSDPYYVGVSFVCGHGDCSDATDIACVTSAGCPSGHVCAARPPSSHSSACIANSPRTLVTSSASSSHGNIVAYGDGGTKFGESPGHSFNGGGTNGGTNVLFLDNSCTARWPFIGLQTGAMFAGVVQINLIMPTAKMVGWAPADNVDDSTRGTHLATFAVANPNAAVSSVWMTVLDVAPSSTGRSCPDINTNYTYGGGHGIQSCGAHATISQDTTSSRAQWNVDMMNWASAKTTSSKPLGTGYVNVAYHCNYNCFLYGLSQ